MGKDCTLSITPLSAVKKIHVEVVHIIVYPLLASASCLPQVNAALQSYPLTFSLQLSFPHSISIFFVPVIDNLGCHYKLMLKVIQQPVLLLEVFSLVLVDFHSPT